MIASIITIGDELLIGQVVDTNSAWMAVELNKAGIWLKRRIAVGDKKEDIVHALQEESSMADIILMTGGLGPTADDITKPVLCEYFGARLVLDEAALDNVKSIFARFNRPLLESNIKQAMVPDLCTVIQNARGTAPGMWFEKDNKVFVSLPGVPHEMKGMMTDFVLPRLKSRFSMPSILSSTLLTAGIGESFLAEIIKDFEQALPAFIKLAYLPNYGLVRLRLTAIGQHEKQTREELDKQFSALKILVKEYLVTDRDETMPQLLARLLKEAGKTISTAESCTGGYIAHLLTAAAGASAFYKGSVVSYSNEIKEQLLEVENNILETKGAVSSETVYQMAAGALRLLKTDYTIAVSGIMGPEGGTAEKPVGTVWVAIGNNKKITTHSLNLRYDRSRNIEMTAVSALNLLRIFMNEPA